MSYINKRCQEPNNKYLSGYDSSKESDYIMYLNANSLYPTVMRDKVLVRKFKWKTEARLDE